MIELEVLGRPIPAVRMTQRSKYNDNAQDYLVYKSSISLLIQLKYPELILAIPPTSIPKERSKFNKTQSDIQYRLYVEVYKADKRGGDWDNFGKTVGDALEQSEVIFNDKQITDGQVKVFLDKENPRLYFRLEKI